MNSEFDPKTEYRESIDEFAGATVELLAEVLKKKHPLITKESMNECISMIGFMLFDSYKRKEEVNGKL